MPETHDSSTADLVHRLREVVGHAQVLVGSDAAGHEQDWTGRWQGASACVVRPGTTGEVAEVVRACAVAGRPVVVQGGNTGLVGGAVPESGAVLLSTRRLDAIGEVDAEGGRVLVGAGATLGAVQEAVAPSGWVVGIDLASRDTATIGGMVATDAGGTRVVAHGGMREQVVGVEVVLADGSVARPWMQGVPKDGAGYDLRHLLVGSEGTLGVITAVLLRLVRPLPTSATLLLGTDRSGLAGLVAAVRTGVASAPGVTLTGCEFVTREGCALVADVLGVHSPVTTPLALLVDLAGPVDDDLLARLDAAGDGPTAVGVDEADRQRLWALRERHTEAIATTGTPVKLDVAVPHAALASFLERAPRAVATVAPEATCLLFGHAAEGNVHVNVTGVADAAAAGQIATTARVEAVETAVYALVGELGGTVSAEHGIGRAKISHLHHTRDAASIAAMRRIKAALDPTGLLNPGVLFPTDDAPPPRTAGARPPTSGTD